MKKIIFSLIVVLFFSLCINQTFNYEDYINVEKYEDENFIINIDILYQNFTNEEDCEDGIDCIDFIKEAKENYQVGLLIRIFRIDVRNEETQMENMENDYNITGWYIENEKYVRKYNYYYSNKQNVRKDFIFTNSEKLFEIRIGYTYDTECFFLDENCKEEEAMEKLNYIENVIEPEFFSNFELK